MALPQSAAAAAYSALSGTFPILGTSFLPLSCLSNLPFPAPLGCLNPSFAILRLLIPLCGDAANHTGERLMSPERDTLPAVHEAAPRPRCAREHLPLCMLPGSLQRAVLHKILILKHFSSCCQFSLWKERVTLQAGVEQSFHPNLSLQAPRLCALGSGCLLHISGALVS